MCGGMEIKCRCRGGLGCYVVESHCEEYAFTMFGCKIFDVMSTEVAHL